MIWALEHTVTSRQLGCALSHGLIRSALASTAASQETRYDGRFFEAVLLHELAANHRMAAAIEEADAETTRCHQNLEAHGFALSRFGNNQSSARVIDQ